MDFKVSVKQVKETVKKGVEGVLLTWEEAVARKNEALFEMHKIITLKKWKKNTK